MIANNDLLISVIVPAYNCEKTINACLNSIMEQDYINFEVIIVDDGSTDNTGIICRSFSKIDDRFKYFYQKNAGVSSARNKGIECANGELICFIDADDYISKKFFKDFVLNNKFDLYICGYSQDFYSATGIINKSIHKQFDNLEIYTMNNIESVFADLYSRSFFNNPWAKIYRKEIIVSNKIMFDRTLSYGEDCVFNMEYLKYVKNIKLISNVNYHYSCFVTESLTSKFAEGKFDVSDLILEKINYLADLYKIEKNRYLFNKIYLKSFYIMIEQSIQNKIELKNIIREIERWLHKKNMQGVMKEKINFDIEFNIYLLVVKLKNVFIIYSFAYIRKLVKEFITRGK